MIALLNDKKWVSGRHAPMLLFSRHETGLALYLQCHSSSFMLHSSFSFNAQAHNCAHAHLTKALAHHCMGLDPSP